MNVRKLLFVLTVFAVIANVAFANEELGVRRAAPVVYGDLEVLASEPTPLSGDEELIVIELASGEEALVVEVEEPADKAVAPDEAMVVSGEEVKVSGEEVVASGEEVKVSGEEVVASGEEVKASGEEVVASGEEVKVSGEEVVASGEEVKVSGEEVVASGEEVKASGEEEASGDVEEVVAEVEYPVDVEEERWYAPTVLQSLKSGLMTVNESGEFLPKENASKEDAINGLSQLVEKTSGDSGEKLFETEDNEDEDINREEAAKLVYEVAKAHNKGFSETWMVLLDYEDVLDISTDCYEAVAWCNVNKVMIGRPDNTFGAKVNINRAELATVLVRLADAIK